MYPTRRVDVDRLWTDDSATMSEHAFQQLMLGVVCGEVAVVIVAFLVFWYKTRRSLDEIEGISAAVYLEVRRTLREFRSNP